MKKDPDARPTRRRGTAGSAGGRTRRPRHRNRSRAPGDGTHQDRVSRPNRGGTATGYRAESARWCKVGKSGQAGRDPGCSRGRSRARRHRCPRRPRAHRRRKRSGQRSENTRSRQRGTGSRRPEEGRTTQAGGWAGPPRERVGFGRAGRRRRIRHRRAAEVPERGVFTAPAAEETVQEFYTSSSEGDYDRSAQLLSEGWRQSTFPNRATFEGTFDKVESVEFVEGPTAEVSGDTATVTGGTRATLTDGSSRTRVPGAREGERRVEDRRVGRRQHRLPSRVTGVEQGGSLRTVLTAFVAAVVGGLVTALFSSSG